MKIVATSWLLVLFVCVLQSQLFADSPPNVVLFLVDDMGWMDSEPYGSKYYRTPSMSRLASESMRFTDAYAVPLCSPTRASILSGQYSARHGVTSASGHLPPNREGDGYSAGKPNQQYLYPESRNYLAPEIVTIAEVLNSNGYRTGHFGKWHLGVRPEHWPENQGFETTWHCAPDPGPPSYFSPYGVVSEGLAAGRRKVGDITDGAPGEYITDRLTDEAIAFLKADDERPFFLNLWQYGVHGPWGHKQDYTEDFARQNDPRGEQGNPIMASMLRSVDESLGRILETLDELKLRENTLFIFYSDNGGNTHSNTSGDAKGNTPADWTKWAGNRPPTNNSPLREGKGRIYEGGQRVPLMIRWPGRILPGTTSGEIVGAIDLYPTILEATGSNAPEAQIIDGVSLLPVLTESASLSRKAYFTWFPHLIPAVSVRRGDWKLIRRFEPHRDYPETLELYNLKEDLEERNNLAKSQPEMTSELNALIDEFIVHTGTLIPIPNPDNRAGRQTGTQAGTQ